MSTQSKTPYELRMDMLQLANDYFKNIQEVSTTVAIQAFHHAMENHKANYDEWSKFAPKQYTFDDVVKKAEELYKFVSTK